MNTEEILKEIKDELEIESTITNETVFKDLQEWDSLNAMVLIGFFSRKFNFSLNANHLEMNTTFGELLNLTR